MKNRYEDIIQQSFDFPVEEFKVHENDLYFHNLRLTDIIEQFGTPLKLTYLPVISEKIKLARKWFKSAFEANNYSRDYHYCYCTKSSHFSYVLEEVLRNNVNLEVSSAYDVDIVKFLLKNGKIDRQIFIICNGFKQPTYCEAIVSLINMGFENVIVVLDNAKELDWLLESATDCQTKIKIGIRIAAEEESDSQFYTSRLGLGYQDIVPFYKYLIENNEKVELQMLHFFVNAGIRDTPYYWNELLKSLNVYCDLAKICPTLDMLDIGGGFPIKQALDFDYDYEYMVNEIVGQIKSTCNSKGVVEPELFTEFGSFTVGESGAALFSVLYQKKQNDREYWNMIDGSFMTSLPDTWALNKKFILLACNHWHKPYQRVFLGGLTCDSDDYYASEQHTNAI